MLEIISKILAVVIAVGLTTSGILAIMIWMKDLTRRTSYLRVLVQIVSVILIFLGLMIGPFGIAQWPPVGIAPRDIVIGTNLSGVPFPDGLSVPAMACYYPSGRTVTCVLWQIQSYLFPYWTVGTGYVTTGLERLAIASGIIILMSVVLGRIFCGWICPFGLYMDLLVRLRKSLRIGYKKVSERLNDNVRQLRYVILAALLLISFVIGARAIIGTELVSETALGKYLETPFCQVCPVKPMFVLIEGALGFMEMEYILSQTTGQFYHLGFFLTSINLVILAAVSLGSFIIRRFWCRFCPLGGLIALFNRFLPFKRTSVFRLDKVEEKCTKCGICERVCPPQVKEVYEEKGGDVTSSGCIFCLRCVEMCPYEDCLKVEVFGKPIYKSKDWLKGLK